MRERSTAGNGRNVQTKPICRVKQAQGKEQEECRDGEARVSSFVCAPTVMLSPICKCEVEWPDWWLEARPKARRRRWWAASADRHRFAESGKLVSRPWQWTVDSGQPAFAVGSLQKCHCSLQITGPSSTVNLL